MFGERKPEPLEKVEEKTEILPQESPATLRIASCGQPQITGAGCVEIPMIVEMSSNGQGKTQSIRLKVAVQLDAFEEQRS
jgi:hypothetical protein